MDNVSVEVDGETVEIAFLTDESKSTGLRKLLDAGNDVKVDTGGTKRTYKTSVETAKRAGFLSDDDLK